MLQAYASALKASPRDIEAAYKLTNKQERSNALNAAREKAAEAALESAQECLHALAVELATCAPLELAPPPADRLPCQK